MKQLSKIFVLVLFLLFISCKNKDYKVGDIVLDDGSVLSVEQLENYSGQAKPMALIFSVTGGYSEDSSRVLGVGLKVSDPAAFSPEGSKAIDTNIRENHIIIAAQEYNITEGKYNNLGLYGLLDGRNTWKNVSKYDDKARKSFKDYPAYDYAVNYGINNNYKKYKNGWYLPTASEAYVLAENMKELQPVFEQSGVTEMPLYIWTSSQCYDGQNNEYVVNLFDAGIENSFKEMKYNVLSIYCFAD